MNLIFNPMAKKKLILHNIWEKFELFVKQPPMHNSKYHCMQNF